MKRAMVMVVFVLGGATFLPVPALALCALCRQALASGGNAGLVKGFYWSIVLIAGVPLAIMAVVAVLVWRHVRAQRVLSRPQAAVGGTVHAEGV